MVLPFFLLLLRDSHLIGLKVLRLVSVAAFGTAMGLASWDRVPQLLLPDTWNLTLLRNMHFLLVSSDFWL